MAALMGLWQQVCSNMLGCNSTPCHALAHEPVIVKTFIFQAIVLTVLAWSLLPVTCMLPVALPPHLQVTVLCNDCGHRSRCTFHVVGHKCDGCSGYNTRRVGDDAPVDPPPAAPAAPPAPDQ